MISNSKYKLKEIIDIPSFQKIQQKFAEMVGLATITLEEDGTPIVNSGSFIRFCSLIRGTEEGYNRCTKSYVIGGEISKKTGKPAIYNCHLGLIHVAAPIIIDGNYIGCTICGQVRCKNSKNKTFININRLSKELNIDKEALSTALKEVPVKDYKKITASGDFLFDFTNYITKLGIETLEKSIIDDDIKRDMTINELLESIEIKDLQEKINPHFLFDAYNTISRIALFENAPNTESLVYTISDILRYNLKNLNSLVYIDSEISNIKKFFTIQKIRNEELFDYEIDIDPTILHYKIPVMTIQPIVENLIIHRLKSRKENIKITGRISDGNIITIEICNNGYEKIEENSAKSIKERGIENVNIRIKHFYGKEYGIDVKKDISMGSSVIIRIPCIELKEGVKETYV